MTQIITRAAPIIDIEIQRGGDGRTVTAYAATFDDPYEVRDEHGHYEEQINRAAFNRVLGRGIAQVQVLFNHGRTIGGTPSEKFSMPLGVPLSITAEPRGLLTVTRYSKTALADETLELIAEGAIRAQSFRGPIFDTKARGMGQRGLPVLERMALGLLEYGPAPFAVNAGAEMLAVRSLDQLVDELTEEERAELARILAQSPHQEPGSDAPSGGLEPGQQPGDTPPAPDTDTPQRLREQAQRRRLHEHTTLEVPQ